MNPIEELIHTRNILVCVGSGGVGKTTTSALLALHAALLGKKVLVLTIDPAKRLANSLGLSELSNEPTRVELPGEDRGEMWAMMLDMKASFDRVVQRHAPEEQRDVILNNRIYQYFSTSLAGTQDYAAAERLFDMYETKKWDLIVLDTPPSTHAIDFLEAPNRLEDAVENKALQWIYKPSVLAGKKGLGVLSMGTSYVLKTIGKLTGGQLLEDLSTFLASFSTLFDGLNARAKTVRETLSSDKSSFIVISSPDTATLDEAASFHHLLARENVRVGAFLINRVHPDWATEAELTNSLELIEKELFSYVKGHTNTPPLSPEATAELVEELRENARQFNQLAESDKSSIATLRRRVGDLPILKIPLLPTDIHSIEGLLRLRAELIFADSHAFSV